MKKIIFTFACFLSFNAFADSKSYDVCINKYQDSMNFDYFAYCASLETEKEMKEITFYYDKLSKLNILQNWNNGNGMEEGNFKTMYENWLSYRNHICSLVGEFWYIVEREDSQERLNAECVLDETKSHKAYLKNMYKNIGNAPLGEFRGVQ